MHTKLMFPGPAPLRRRKRRLWIPGLVLGYAILGFLILPPIVRVVAVKQLSKQLGREVTLQKLRLNPFVLSATVRGLLIKDNDGEPFVSWDEVYVNFQLSSFFGHPWVFKEISTTRPFVRVKVNRDHSLNFTDLITKFSTNSPPKGPTKPLALHIGHLRISGATASLTDLTPRTPFHRTLGPLDVTLNDFRTDPNQENPYSFAGTTDAGGKFAWTGYFCLDPLRSQGEFSLENLALNKYAPLYQDLVRFEIKDGVVDLRSTYRLEFGVSNRLAVVTNTTFRLRAFKVGQPGTEPNLLELPEFTVAGASADTVTRQAQVDSVTVWGARVNVRRDQDNTLNVVELSKPAEGATNAPGGVLLLLRAVTNAVSLLLASTNAWTGSLREVKVQDCALHLEDHANSRPVQLDLDQIALSASHISNLPGTNLSANLSLRWNTNGSIRTDIQAAFAPTTVDIQLALDRLELRPLDPYLESNLNVFIRGSKLGLDGLIHLSTTNAGLPQIAFHGNARLDDFSALDGVLGEDLLTWGSVRVSGIDANLNPPAVAIKEVAVDDAFARVIIETNRTINLLAALRMADTNAPVAAPEGEKHTKSSHAGKPVAVGKSSTGLPATPKGASSLPSISVASVVISNAQVRFSDRSVSPSVNLSIQQAGGTIAGLSSEQLQHAEIRFEARVDNVGPVEITGTINPFSNEQTNDLKIVVKNVDLTPTSPYVGKFAGYRLAEGKLGLDLAYHLTGRKLKSQNRVTLDRFTFGDKVESPEATKLPVRLAIAILKDRQGKIELDLPIEGSLDDPEFRIHKVVVRALLNLLTKVATSPFALLGSLVGGKSEEIGYQDFAPGSAALEAGGKDKLETLLKVLYERPALQLEIEGSVEPVTDLTGLRHRSLDEKLRTRKWMSLRKSERAATAPGQVTFTPEERSRWLRDLYAEMLSKGEIGAALAETNQGAALTSAPTSPGAAPAAVVPWSQLFPPESSRGASLLMGTPATTSRSRSRTTGGGASPKAGTAVVDPVEQALLDNIPITDADFQALVAERAKAVREYLLQSGKVEAGRIFLAEAAAGGPKSKGSRVYLQLR